MTLWAVQHEDKNFWNGMERWFTPNLDFAMKFHSAAAARQASIKGLVSTYSKPIAVIFEDGEWRMATPKETEKQVFLETHREKLGRNFINVDTSGETVS